MIDQLIIKQRLEGLEAAAGLMGYNFETENKYKIKNVLGQNIYQAKEDTECCTRQIYPGFALIGRAPTLLHSHWSRIS